LKSATRFFVIAVFLCSGAVALGHFAHAHSHRQAASAGGPECTIQAIRYATVHDFPLSDLVIGAPGEKKIDVAMIVWLIQGGGHTILFDSGFHLDRVKSLDEFHIADYLRPDEAVKLAGVDPAAVTDVIISHAHWDHIDGIDLFPKAVIWIQKAEFEYYTGAAWQPGGQNGGIYPEDAIELVRRNTLGQVRLVNGDDALILPGIRLIPVRGTRLRRNIFAWRGILRLCWLRTIATCMKTCVSIAPALRLSLLTSLGILRSRRG
jgi:hypothetical protein